LTDIVRPILKADIKEQILLADIELKTLGQILKTDNVRQILLRRLNGRYCRQIFKGQTLLADMKNNVFEQIF
jgi:hypothetical protein